MDETPEIQQPDMAFEAFLEQYDPSGSVVDKEYMTTDDIAYTLREIHDVPTGDIYKRITSAGYGIEFVDGRPYFALYRKQSSSYFEK